jgi:starch-binding outer membrane protein, SusD/RagB family
MKHYKIKIIIVVTALIFAGCKKYLDYQPQGVVAADELTSPTAVEGLTTAAYAGIANDWFDAPITSLMVWGSIRSDDAYKGGGGLNDNQQWDKYEQFYLLNSSNNGGGDFGFTGAWIRAYGAISRCNAALRALNNVTDAQFPNKTVRTGEMHFLRGHLFFLLKVMFNRIPWFDETLTDDQIKLVPNTMSSDSLWYKIEGDFQTAINDLPPSQPGDPGRANQLAAKAYLAKALLYHAYTQDAQYNVTGVDMNKLQQVVTLTNDVINSGTYSLNTDFAYNFLDGHDNGPESIFAYQYSINDGTAIGGRLSMANSLDYFAGNPLYGCCAFHIPSQNLVNAFGTDANGLPRFDTFNSVVLTDDSLTTNGTLVDPRIDHTVAIKDHPFKYDPGMTYQHSWERDNGDYGGFGTMKELQLPTCACFKKLGPFYGTSVNVDVIRYDDVLLWQAEAQIQLGNQAAALPLINQIRTRAANISPLVKNSSGQYPSNYKIDIYKPGVNIPVWDQQTAFKALQWERRIEFAMEGFRFFDLVRWGIAGPTLNNFFSIEKGRHNFLNNANFTHGIHEYFPIPEEQIVFTNGLYTQNNGY